jgi:hypothetical protein
MNECRRTRVRCKGRRPMRSKGRLENILIETKSLPGHLLPFQPSGYGNKIYLKEIVNGN